MSDMQKDLSIHFFVITMHESFNVEFNIAQNILFFGQKVKELSFVISEKALSVREIPQSVTFCLPPWSRLFRV